MKVPYALLEWIIWIEIVFVIVLIIVTYLLWYHFTVRRKYNERIAREVEEYLEKSSGDNQTFDAAHFPEKWRHLDILLPLIFKLDTNKSSAMWRPHMRENIAHAVLLPLARKKYVSRIWMNRLLSSQCFELWMEMEDEDKIAKLLEDKIPIVHLHATIAAIKFGTPKLVNIVINNMSKRRRLGQTVYLKIFESARPTIRPIIEQRLTTEKDNFARAACYKILMMFKEYNPELDTSKDLESPNMELRLSAMRYTALAKKQDAIPYLVKLLADPQWEVRAGSIRLLGDLHAEQCIGEVANGLKDKSWWVRVNAANTLKSFGEAGLAILNAQDPVKDKYAYETAMHVLNKTAARPN